MDMSHEFDVFLEICSDLYEKQKKETGTGNAITFPDTVEEFMERYKITGTDGTEFVPIFRMKQWFEHKERE